MLRVHIIRRSLATIKPPPEVTLSYPSTTVGPIHVRAEWVEDVSFQGNTTVVPRRCARLRLDAYTDGGVELHATDKLEVERDITVRLGEGRLGAKCSIRAGQVDVKAGEMRFKVMEGETVKLATTVGGISAKRIGTKELWIEAERDVELASVYADVGRMMSMEGSLNLGSIHGIFTLETLGGNGNVAIESIAGSANINAKHGSVAMHVDAPINPELASKYTVSCAKAANISISREALPMKLIGIDDSSVDISDPDVKYENGIMRATTSDKDLVLSELHIVKAASVNVTVLSWMQSVMKRFEKKEASMP